MKTVFATIALAVAAGAAFGQISSVNSWKVEERIFNNFPDSTLVTTNNWPAGNLRFNETFQQTPGGFANKHVGYFSNDNGASRYQFQNAGGFRMNFNVRLSAPNGQPRKEAGIDVRNYGGSPGFYDEGQLLIASDGEVAVFGGAMPFIGFGGSAYTRGTVANVSFEYVAPDAFQTTGAIRLIFTDAVNGVFDSGYRAFSDPNFMGFNNGSELGLKAQNQRNPFIADSSDIEYSRFSVIPAPGAASVLALAGLMAARRRR